MKSRLIFFPFTLVFALSIGKAQNAVKAAQLIKNVIYYGDTSKSAIQHLNLFSVRNSDLYTVSGDSGAFIKVIENLSSAQSDYLKNDILSLLEKDKEYLALKNLVSKKTVINKKCYYLDSLIGIYSEKTIKNWIAKGASPDSTIRLIDLINCNKLKNSYKKTLDSALNAFKPPAKAKTATVIEKFKPLIALKEINTLPHVFEITNQYNTVKGSAGIPSQTEIIDAMAIFIARRVKEEMVLTFVDRLNKNIGKLSPLPCLFKNTINQLKGYAPYEIPQFGSVMKKTIALDIAQMPDNIFNCDSCKLKSKTNFKEYTSFFNDVTTGVDLITNISRYSEMEVKDTLFSKALKTFDVLNNYFSSFKEKTPESNWVQPEEINQDEIFKLSLALVYEKEKEVFDSIVFKAYSVKSLNDLFDTTKINVFKEFKTRFKNTLYELHNLSSYWHSNENEGKAIVDLVIYNSKVQNVLESIYSFLKIDKEYFPPNDTSYIEYIKAKEAVAIKDIEGIMFYSQRLLDLLSCYKIELPKFELGWDRPNIDWQKLNLNWPMISSKFPGWNFDSDSLTFSIHKYSFFVPDIRFTGSGWKHKIKLTWVLNFPIINIDSYQILSLNELALKLKGFKWQKCSDKKKRNALVKELKKKPILDECFATKFKNNKYQQITYGKKREVTQVLSLLGDILKAKDSKQLSQVIEEYAEPSQSYKIKRHTRYSADLNAFPGFFFTGETFMKSAPFQTDTSTRFAMGVTCPIGLTMSWSNRKKYKCGDEEKYTIAVHPKGKWLKTLKGGCWMLTTTFIDIGAPLSFRWSNDDSQSLPKEVTFAQVLSPGIYVGWGVPHTPIAIQVGGQIAPQLRNFTDSPDKLENAYRFGLSLTFDIPMWNIWNTSKGIFTNR